MISSQIRKWALRKILETSINAFVVPALFYAIEVWYPAGEKHKKQIEKVNKYACRLLTNNFSRDVSYEELTTKLGWKPIH
jgi:hypothetical protein